MVRLSATQARTNFFSLLKRSIKKHEPVGIHTKEGDAVLIAQDDYESLIETLELLSTPGFAKSIEKAKKEIKKGETFSIDEVFGKK